MRVPSASRYRAALEEIRAQISPFQWRLLEAHYLAPNHTASSEEIALAGRQAVADDESSLRSALHQSPSHALGQTLASGEQQSSILAFFEPPSERVQFFQRIMHASLAAAICELAWFGADDVVTRPVNAQLENPRAIEGRKQQRLAIHRQREISLRRAKLDAFRRGHHGRLFCEVPGCGFNFETVYGHLGRGFAEVHHLRPLAELDGPISTTLTDLAVVCANCHRMIHRNSECRALEAIVPKSNSRRG